MTSTRRDFVTLGTLGSLGLLAPGLVAQTQNKTKSKTPATPPSAQAGVQAAAAPHVGTGPAVTEADFAAAEKLAQVELSAVERAQAAANWQTAIANVYERRTGPRKLALEETLAPATVWNPAIPEAQVTRGSKRMVRSLDNRRPLPKTDAEIAYAPVSQLARWLQSRQLTSELLTRIYLERLEHYDGQLHCLITLMREQALQQARKADAEIAAGRYRGPLHGIPWGAKDLLDTAGVATTYGAEPFRTRVPAKDAVVKARLDAAGAVLIAKLSMGALAMNDVWFGGQTMNPWLPVEGSSGSSAGPGSAVAAGLVGFAIGSETNGSIVSPSVRCGIAGLRPTFGRVPRTGAMTLCWSLDKLGPMTRGVEDTLLVLDAISGPDAGDAASVESTLHYDALAPVAGMRVGYFPGWMKDATDVDRKVLATVKALSMQTVEVSLPDWPYQSLETILLAEAAAAFEELTLTHGVDALRMQMPDAWPNTFRQARFLSAVDLVQADRLRRKVAREMARIFSSVDVLLVPSLREEMLTITNFTGHPSLTLRAGFVEVSEARSDWAPDSDHPLPKFETPKRVPQGVTLVGKLFDEGTLGQVGVALERALDVEQETPPLFG